MRRRTWEFSEPLQPRRLPSLCLCEVLT